MPRTSPALKAETLTFRIEPKLKSALARIARAEHRPVGELLRDLVRARIERGRRRAFEAEARRESLILAEAARDPNSDEAAMMRELEADLAAFADEWK